MNTLHKSQKTDNFSMNATSKGFTFEVSDNNFGKIIFSYFYGETPIISLYNKNLNRTDYFDFTKQFVKDDVAEFILMNVDDYSRSELEEVFDSFGFIDLFFILFDEAVSSSRQKGLPFV